MSNSKTITRGDRVFTLTINPDDYVKGRFRIIATEGDTIVGYCALKPASNAYTRGYRITNYSVFSAKGLGIGQEMIKFFEEWKSKSVIPSGVFGATGELTRSGKDAATKRMSRDRPEWLPDNWEEEMKNTPIIEGLIAVPETMLREAMQIVARGVLSYALTLSHDIKALDHIHALAHRYAVTLIPDYEIKNKPVKIERLKATFSELPDHYPSDHRDDIWVALDWRASSYMAGWHKSKKVVLIYPMAQGDLKYFPRDLEVLDAFLDQTTSSVKHELRHAVQTIMLPAEQNAQTYTAGDNNAMDYNLSPNEFDPIIGTIADEIVYHIGILISYGQKPNANRLIKQTVGMIPTPIGEKPQPFFIHLRKNDPKRYKLAIKKLISEVGRQLTSKTM